MRLGSTRSVFTSVVQSVDGVLSELSPGSRPVRHRNSPIAVRSDRTRLCAFAGTLLALSALSPRARGLDTPLGENTELSEASGNGISAGGASSRFGDATASYPLVLPPVPNGMMPSLGLSYSSSGGDSQVGYGWSLSGTLVISRDARERAPSYTDQDRFVVGSGFGSGATLIRMRALSPTVTEYRAEEGATQYLFDSSKNTWTIRTEDGVVSTLVSGLSALEQGERRYDFFFARDGLSDEALNTPNRTAAWVRTESVDPNGNAIDYRFASSQSSRFEESGMIGRAEAPVLVEVQYGGNKRIGRPHLFRVLFGRHFMPLAEELRAYAPPVREDRCRPEVAYETPSMRLGGVLRDKAESRQVWGIATFAVRESTSPEKRARQSSLIGLHRFLYNVDTLGCGSEETLHSHLVKAEYFGVSESGQVTEGTSANYAYHPWTRRFRSVEVELPAAHAYVSPNPADDARRDWRPWRYSWSAAGPIGLSPQLAHGLGAVATSDQSGQVGLSLGGGFRTETSQTSRPSDYGLVSVTGPFALLTSGAEQGLLDIDQDGLVDFYDIADSLRCYRGATESHGGWYRNQGLSRTSSGASLFSARSSMSWDALYDSMLPNALRNCGTSQYLSIHTGWELSIRGREVSDPTRLPARRYQLGRVLEIDVDGDGYRDIVRAEALATSQQIQKGGTQTVDFRWVWHRNLQRETGSVAFAEPAPFAVFPWELGQVAELAHEGTFFGDESHSRGIWSGEATDLLERYVARGRGVLFANHTTTWTRGQRPLFQDHDAFYNMVVNDSRYGAVLDITGDGLPDRVAATSLVLPNEPQGSIARDRRGSVVVYRGLAPGVFGPAELWYRAGDKWRESDPQAIYERDFPRVTHRSLSFSGVSDDVRYPETRTVVTDTAGDLNGDGLVDLMTVEPASDPNRQTSLYPTTLSSMQVFYNYGHGLISASVLSDGTLPEAFSETRVSAVAPGVCRGVVPGCAFSNVVRTSEETTRLGEYNGDAYPDLMGRTAAGEHFVQLGTGEGFSAPFFIDPVSIGMSAGGFVGRSMQQPASLVVQNKRVIADVTGDGRDDAIELIEATATSGPRARVETDVDPSAAPGLLQSIRLSTGSETKFHYATMAEMRPEGERSGPIRRYLLRAVEETAGPRSPGMRRLVRYAYHDAVYGPTSHTAMAEAYPRQSYFKGFATTIACYNDGTQSQTYGDYSGLLDGRVKETRLYGALTDPLAPGKAIDLDTPCEERVGTTAAEGLRQRSLFAYETHLRMSEMSLLEGSADIFVKDQTSESYLPGQALVMARQTTHTYEEVLGRWVRTRSVSTSVPESPKETTDVRMSYAFFDSADLTKSYRILPTETASYDSQYGLLSKVRFYYDNRALGDFVSGSLTSLERVARERSGESEAQSQVTSIVRDTIGNIVQVRSPMGYRLGHCMDRFGLYPVRTQGPTGAVTETVLDYGTGLVLETQGPVGLSTAPMVCPALSFTGTLGIGKTDAPLPVPAWPARKIQDLVYPRLVAHLPQRLVPTYADEPSETRDGDEAVWLQGPSWADAMEHVTSTPQRTHEKSFVTRDFGGGALVEASGMPAAVIDQTPGVSTSRAHYDGLGRLTSIEGIQSRDASGTFRLSTILERHYYAMGLDTAEWTALTTTPSFDRNRAALSVVQTNGFGQVLTSASVLERSDTSFGRWVTSEPQYDALGRQTGTIFPTPDDHLASGGRGMSQVTARDNLGSPTETENAAGHRSRVAYRFIRTAENAIRLVTRTTDEAGLISESETDSLGRAVLARGFPILGSDAQVLESTTEYDAAGRPRIARDPLGAVIQSQYNLLGQLARTDRYGSEADFASNRPLRSWVYAYDQDGKVTHVTESAPGEAPRTTETVYDAATGRYSGTVMPALAPASGIGNYGNVGVQYENRYTENGFLQVKRVTTATGAVDYEFGPRGEIVRELHTVFARFGSRTLRDSYAVRYAYNQGGALTDVVYEGTPGVTTESIHYAIDHDGKLQKVEDLRAHRTLTRLETNDAGVLRKLHDGDEGQAGGVEEFQYTAAGHMRDHIIGYENASGMLRTDAPTLTETVYRHENGLPYASTVVDTGFSDLERMTYYASIDGMGRLGFVQGSLQYRAGSGRPFSAFLVSSTYDRARLDTRTELMPGAESRTLIHEYASRDPSRMTSLSEMGRGTVYAAQYDGFGTMRVRDGQAITNDPTEQPREDQNNLYTYLPNGIRQFTYNKQTGHIRGIGPAGIELDYELVSGINGADTSESGFIRTGFHIRLGHIRMDSHGPGAIPGTADGSTPLTYLHQDQQHSIILSRGATPTDTALRYAFAPYGQTLFTSPGGETFPHRYGYQSGEMGSTGLIRFGVRDYDSVSGKMIKNDLVITNDAQGYALDNPIATWDPTGMDPPRTQTINFDDEVLIFGRAPQPTGRSAGAAPQATDDERPGTGTGAGDAVHETDPFQLNSAPVCTTCPTVEEQRQTQRFLASQDTTSDRVLRAMNQAADVVGRTIRAGAGGVLDPFLPGIDRHPEDRETPTFQFGRAFGQIIPAIVPMLRAEAAAVRAAASDVPLVLPRSMGAAGNITLRSRIGESRATIRLAENMSVETQRDVDNLIAQFRAGNPNPGIGTRPVGSGLFELRGRNRGRVILRQVSAGTFDIVAKLEAHLLGADQHDVLLQRIVADYVSRTGGP